MIKKLPLLLFMLSLLNVSTAWANERQKDVISAKVLVSFPQLNIKDVKAKVDTGARSSSMHCTYIKVNTKKGWVAFKPLNAKKIFRMPLTRIANVKSSNASVSSRPFILLDIVINNRSYSTEFSLSDRLDLKSPILLGRQLLRGNFIIEMK